MALLDAFVRGFSYNWLQLFQRAHTALLGSGGGPEHRTSLAPSEKCAGGYRCSGLLLESYAACLSAKPLSSQYSPKRHNTVSECVAKYTSALSTEAVNTANSLKYWLWVARFFVFFHRVVYPLAAENCLIPQTR